MIEVKENIKTKKMTNWRKRVYNHLENYKLKSLHIMENGIFREKEYGHILPCKDGSLNYIGSVREHESDFKEIKHMYWYHLNSSQTMCVNFFIPLIERKLLSDFFSRVLNIDIKIKRNEFEYEIEKNSTNFDFYVEDTNNHKYYFEIKYTEDTVNKKADAKNASVAYSNFYQKEVQSNPTFVNANVDMDMFMNKHYQAYRNMVKAHDGNYSIFITMDGNEGVDKEINIALADLKLNCETAKEKNIIILHWKDVVEKTRNFVKDEELVEHYKEFKKKYIEL